jgi:hypothetical protein
MCARTLRIAGRRGVTVVSIGFGLSLVAAYGQSTAPAAGNERTLRFSAADREQAVAWQEKARTMLFDFLQLSDLVETDLSGAGGKPRLEFKVTTTAVTQPGQGRKFTRYDLELNSTPHRRMPVVLTVPEGAGKFPAVVCIHGHGDSRKSVYDPTSIYRGFARELGNRGYITIATEVGQHTVYEKQRTLMGERLWDVIRLVSYLTTRPDVDAARIGCAGLSLGGEMAMWLGAMDARVKVTVSSGFLTTVANMRNGHCKCWEFPHLTEHFEFADIYSLIAPRPLLCQIGRQERAGGGFPVELAQHAFGEVKRCYKVFKQEDAAVLAVHPAGHVFDLASAIPFLDKALRPTTAAITPPTTATSKAPP